MRRHSGQTAWFHGWPHTVSQLGRSTCPEGICAAACAFFVRGPSAAWIFCSMVWFRPPGLLMCLRAWIAPMHHASERCCGRGWSIFTGSCHFDLWIKCRANFRHFQLCPSGRSGHNQRSIILAVSACTFYEYKAAISLAEPLLRRTNRLWGARRKTGFNECSALIVAMSKAFAAAQLEAVLVFPLSVTASSATRSRNRPSRRMTKPRPCRLRP